MIIILFYFSNGFIFLKKYTYIICQKHVKIEQEDGKNKNQDIINEQLCWKSAVKNAFSVAKNDSPFARNIHAK